MGYETRTKHPKSSREKFKKKNRRSFISCNKACRIPNKDVIALHSESPIFPRRYEDECSQRICAEKEFIALKKVSKGTFEPSSPGLGLWGAHRDLFPQNSTQNKYKQELVLRFA